MKKQGGFPKKKHGGFPGFPFFPRFCTWQVSSEFRVTWPSEILSNFGGSLTVTVTTRIITFLVGDPYKASFPTATVRRPYPK